MFFFSKKFDTKLNFKLILYKLYYFININIISQKVCMLKKYNFIVRKIDFIQLK